MPFPPTPALRGVSEHRPRLLYLEVCSHEQPFHFKTTHTLGAGSLPTAQPR